MECAGRRRSRDEAGPVPAFASTTATQRVSTTNVIQVHARQFRVRRLRVPDYVRDPASRGARADQQRQQDARRRVRASHRATMERCVRAAGRRHADEQLRHAQLLQRTPALTACRRGFHERDRHADPRLESRQRRAGGAALLHRQHRHRRSRRAVVFGVRAPVGVSREGRRRRHTGQRSSDLWARPAASRGRIYTGACDSTARASIRCR